MLILSSGNRSILLHQSLYFCLFLIPQKEIKFLLTIPPHPPSVFWALTCGRWVLFMSSPNHPYSTSHGPDTSDCQSSPYWPVTDSWAVLFFFSFFLMITNTDIHFEFNEHLSNTVGSFRQSGLSALWFLPSCSWSSRTDRWCVCKVMTRPWDSCRIKASWLNAMCDKGGWDCVLGGQPFVKGQ